MPAQTPTSAHDARPAAAPPPPDTFQPIAGLLAFLLPGAGHAYLGDLRRGLLIAGGVFGLFFTGLLVGGIATVDSGNFIANRLRGQASASSPPVLTEGEPIWFIGQALTGPTAFIVDWLHQNRFKVVVTAPDAISDPGRRAFPFARPAHPFEIRDPASAAPVRVRNPITDEPIEFTDPATGQRRLSTPADRPPYVKPLGRPAELGTLFSTVAGLLNLIAITDALHNHRRTRRAASGPRGNA